MKIVNRYIGVEAGYLGDFSYRTHREFYPEYCDLKKDPDSLEGTTRERFIQIYLSSTPRDQSKIINGVIERFPIDEGPKTRSKQLKQELQKEAEKLLSLDFVDDPDLSSINSEALFEILEDAQSLILNRKASSAIDRVHTALHGYLRNICKQERIAFDQKDDIVLLLKKLFKSHSKLSVVVKEHEIQNIVKNLASILTSLNPIRNQGSRAHPNEIVLEEPEAVLVVNTVRTILTYLDAKLK